MGEYHTIEKDGEIVQVCKLGVMDHMQYVTKEEAELLAIFDAGQTDIPEILVDFATLWRFPWPDEAIEINYLIDLEPIYQDICQNIVQRDGSRTLNFKADLELGNHQYCSKNFSIAGERHSQRGRRTIIRCNKCQKLWSLSQLNLLLVKKAIVSLGNQEPEFLFQVAKRLKPQTLKP